MLSIGKQHVLVLWHWHTACLHINVNPKDLWTKRDGTSDFTCVLCLGYNNENDNDEWFHPQCSAEFIPRRSPKNNSEFMGRWNNPSRVDVIWKVKSHESQHRINGNMHICEIHFRICFLCSPRVTQTSWNQVFFKCSKGSDAQQLCREVQIFTFSLWVCLVSVGVLMGVSHPQQSPDLPLPWRPIGRAPDPLLSRPRWHPINAGLQCYYLQDRFPALGPNKKRLFCIYPSDWHKWLQRGERKLSGSFFFAVSSAVGPFSWKIMNPFVKHGAVCALNSNNIHRIW